MSTSIKNRIPFGYQCLQCNIIIELLEYTFLWSLWSTISHTLMYYLTLLKGNENSVPGTSCRIKSLSASVSIHCCTSRLFTSSLDLALSRRLFHWLKQTNKQGLYPRALFAKELTLPYFHNHLNPETVLYLAELGHEYSLCVPRQTP